MLRSCLISLAVFCQAGTASPAEPKKTAEWSVPFPGRALHSQVLILDGTLLYALGGNASPGPHDFSPEAFVDEAFRFDIGQQAMKKLPSLPVALQSGSGVINAQTSEHRSLVVVGGLGHRDGQFQSLRELYEYSPEGEAWTRLDQQLPESRSMFTAVNYDDAIWMFGGAVAGQDRRLPDNVLHWWGDETAVAPLPEVTLPTPRRSFGGAVIQDEFYMVGGLTGDGSIAATVSVFHFRDRTWREAPAPRVARVFPSLTVMYDRLYLHGGFSRTDDGHFAPAPSLETFDPATGEWTTVAESLPGVEPSMTMLTLNRRLLFYGIDGSNKTAKFVMLDPSPREKPAQVAPLTFDGQRENPARRNAKQMMRKDTDKDGQLSRQELGTRLAGFFQKADRDQNGLLTFAEVLTTLEAQSTEEPPDQRD